MALNLRLSEAQDRALTELARSQGVSKNEAALRAIEDAWARRGHEDQVRDLTRGAVERYRPLLDRLAQ
ncbi:ribbon-helix-helix protein, CopG family [Georgenia subflava]|uniref:Ribbon-helix-helix protein, CopG family n=1 Tax=Georgenia subflava TaxID=1622177 RepID=A0A6N7EK27_9MICO|nr:ribbon-helix-helix protein, CopG family [Georgenia subflava]MPV38420.1 ribbon-helix-helix protein, CopG family [Georgenia subflava]